MSNVTKVVRTVESDILGTLAEALTRGNNGRVPTDIDLLSLYEWAELAELQYSLLQLVLAGRLDVRWSSEMGDFLFSRRDKRCKS